MRVSWIMAVSFGAAIALASPSAHAGTNMCPTATASSVSVAMDGMVNSNLMASDPDGDPLTYQVTTAPAHGTVVVQSLTGAFTYFPVEGYCGPDSFKFKVNDGECDSNEATVSITVCDSTATATPTPTATPTLTPTSTPTPTPVPQGGSCMSSPQCVAGLFCADGFCCDRPCDLSFDVCDEPGREGTCVSAAAAAPVTSSYGLAGIVGALLAIGVLGVVRTRRRAA